MERVGDITTGVGVVVTQGVEEGKDREAIEEVGLLNKARADTVVLRWVPSADSQILIISDYSHYYYIHSVASIMQAREEGKDFKN